MTKYAMLIGINEYHESLGRLNYCVPDAELLRQTLLDTCGFAQDNVLLLADGQGADRLPTYGNMHAWLAKWLSLPDEDDLVVVYPGYFTESEYFR